MLPYWDNKAIHTPYSTLFVFNYFIVSLILIEKKILFDVIWDLKSSEKGGFKL